MTDWTDERVARLKKLWLDGKSAAEIAKTMTGVTRNAVIGKVHRLGLAEARRTAPSKPGPKAAPRELRAPAVAAPEKRKKYTGSTVPQRVKLTSTKELPPLRAAEVTPKPVPFLDRTKFQCSVILDGYDEPTCCGDKVDRRSLCAGHAATMLGPKLPPMNAGLYASLGNVVLVRPGYRPPAGAQSLDSVLRAA